MTLPTRAQQIGLLMLLAALAALAFVRALSVAVMPSAARSSPSSVRPPPARARSASRSRSGSAARSSTAIRPRSIAASTSAPTRCRSTERRGIPHHLIDVADPTEEYTAARYARDAAAAIRDITGARQAADPRRRHRLLLPRADARLLSRARTRRGAARAARADRGAPRAGAAASRCCGGSIRRPARRIQPRDRKRVVRALEVYLLTGRPLTAHFAEHRVAAARLRGHRDRAADPAGADRRAGGAARRRAVRRRAARRDPRRCSRRGARDRASRSAGWSTARRSSTCTACATRRRRAR